MTQITCSICGANHNKLNIQSCEKVKCRGELFYHIYFKDLTSVMYDTTYDALWDWGIVLNPSFMDQIDVEDNLWILSTDGQEIIEWSRKYDYNFSKLYTAYSTITYYKSHEIYSISVNKPMIYGLHFYMINKNRKHNDLILRLPFSPNSPARTLNQDNHEGGIAMYALVIIQRFWSKLFKMKKYLKYKNFLYKIFEKGTNKDLDSIEYTLSFI